MMGTVWSHTPTRSREVAGFHTQDRKDQAITERSLRSSYAPAACGLPRGPCGRFQEEGGSGTGWQASCHAARLRPWARSSAPPTLTAQAPSHSLQSSRDTASQGRPVPPGLSFPSCPVPMCLLTLDSRVRDTTTPRSQTPVPFLLSQPHSPDKPI